MSELDWADINSKLPFSRDEAEVELRKEMWAGIDVNGNGFVSLSEVTAVRLCSLAHSQHRAFEVNPRCPETARGL